MQLRGHVEQVPGPTGATAIGVGAGEFRRNLSGPLPAVLMADFALDWKVCGSGVLTWSVFRLYRATLHAPGVFDADRPFAIDLSYLRRIPADQIVERTIDEIRRLRTPDHEALTRWQGALSALIPDVSLGSRLIGVFEPGRGVSFYSDAQRLGEVCDPKFAESFAAIWLDPQARSPALRAALLGEAHAQ